MEELKCIRCNIKLIPTRVRGVMECPLCQTKVEGTEKKFTCEKCGEAIASGRYCIACQTEIGLALKGKFDEDAALRRRLNSSIKFTGRMHIER